MRYNLPDRVFRELTTLAQKYSVTKIILFGSRARGTHTERSDIDIVVYGGDFDNFYWDVKENIYSLLIFDIIQADAPISDTLKEEIKKMVSPSTKTNQNHSQHQFFRISKVNTLPSSTTKNSVPFLPPFIPSKTPARGVPRGLRSPLGDYFRLLKPYISSS